MRTRPPEPALKTFTPWHLGQPLTLVHACPPAQPCSQSGRLPSLVSSTLGAAGDDVGHQLQPALVHAAAGQAHRCLVLCARAANIEAAQRGVGLEAARQRLNTWVDQVPMPGPGQALARPWQSWRCSVAAALQYQRPLQNLWRCSALQSGSLAGPAPLPFTSALPPRPCAAASPASPASHSFLGGWPQALPSPVQLPQPQVALQHVAQGGACLRAQPAVAQVQPGQHTILAQHLEEAKNEKKKREGNISAQGRQGGGLGREQQGPAGCHQWPMVKRWVEGPSSISPFSHLSLLMARVGLGLAGHQPVAPHPPSSVPSLNSYRTKPGR
ncbi:hypothetical protein HaLaN_10518 [Haematococcus lacustris]|uniref:Uncharacterized protein n=1 Tax=Haematococcus lacustris TaxID=44745 RepID=A0A699YW40_HAELA|nr:hypothetical protein HaLaN_10518 [Haematococcus lacustris]